MKTSSSPVKFLNNAFLICFCGLMYWYTWQLLSPGFDGVFMMDDEPSLAGLNMAGGVNNVTNAKQFILGNSSGELGRPISMASFLIDDQYWPGSPATYKTTNYYFHLITALLIVMGIYAVARRVTSARGALLFALATASAWVIHPLNVSTVLYVVQRMTILMSLFTMLAVYLYVSARFSFDRRPGKSLLLLSLSAFSVGLAVLSKENGILAFAYMLVLEVTILRRFSVGRAWSKLSAVFCLVPLSLLIGYFLINWNAFFYGYNLRDFTMLERLLTEQRILLDYLWKIIVPQSSVGSLVNDDYVISTSLFQPLSTLISLAANLMLIVGAIIWRNRFSIIAFAILWFYAGHFLESSFIGLELYFEHRNYLPMLGPIICIVYGAFHLYNKASLPKLRLLVIVFSVLILAWSSLVTHQVASLWGEPSVLYRVWAHEHPDSPRAQRIYGQLLYAENEPEKSIQQLVATHEQFPKDVGVLIDAARIACESGLPQPFPIDWLQRRINQGQYVDGLTYYVEQLSKIVASRECSWLSDQDFSDLVHALKELPKLTGESRAKILFWGAHVHIERRNLNAAMMMLEDAFAKHKSPMLLVLQAKLLLSAGLVAEAHGLLIQAKILVDEKPLKHQVIGAELDSLLSNFSHGGNEK